MRTRFRDFNKSSSSLNIRKSASVVLLKIEANRDDHQPAQIFEKGVFIVEREPNHPITAAIKPKDSSFAVND